MMNVRNMIMGVLATLFGIVALAGMLASGEPTVQKLAVSAALCGCMSQFLGQSELRKVRIAADVVAGLGVVAVLVALAVW